MKFSICIRAGILMAIASNTIWISTAQARSDSANISKLAEIINRSLQANPEILAAQFAVDAAKAHLAGTALPLNNPELEGEAERTDINTFQLGISQTIDWHDKRSALEQVAQTELQTMQQQLTALRLEKSTGLMDAIGRISIQSAINDLSQRRTEVLKRFTTLAEKRHTAGDIPRAELELARLSLSEASMAHARNQAELILANNDFLALSGQILTEAIRLPQFLSIDPKIASDTESLARQHPQVQVALLKSQIAKKQINATDRERKSDPTFGVSAGREDDNNLLAVRFSIPLQVRNNYQSNVDVARAEALQAEQEAQQVYWNLRAQLKSAKQRYEIISAAWKQWLNQGQTSLRQRAKLLEILWQAGEIDTTDYLLQVQQTLDTQIAGIKLHGDLWKSWLDWMNTSSKLDTWLNQKN
ncbi:MAG TPA: TolC family protein [Thiolapillus brandeum]|uniref:TolC family protein n=1 Tax=Thiolapillus brandeum TaxID=1076588 RepID=A0A831K872_9GAMM|nr:TolC family protein [Thiolapillus brandeum]